LVWHVANALRNTSVSDTLCVANVPKADPRKTFIEVQLWAVSRRSSIH
jgi:hypothetical protein